MLQTPALGLAQAGMIRRKNSLSMLMQTLTGLSVGSVLWFAVGYSLVFGQSQYGLIGGLHDSFLQMTIADGPDSCSPYAKTIPSYLFFSFQMMFALRKYI